MSPSKVVFALLLLAACETPVPDSAAGVGFGDYSDYIRQREAERMRQISGSAQPTVSTQPTVSAQPNTGFSTERVGAALDASEIPGQPVSGSTVQQGVIIGQTNGERPRGDAPTGIKVETGEMQGHGRISDEQDFQAVSARETIQSDAERLAENRAQYQVIAPTALPQRTGKAEPNIVQFALSTNHAPGVQKYRRSTLFAGSGSACSKYAAPDLAQEAFLANGGPEKDRKGLDPDGDGYACGWDPRPFRSALR